MPIREPNFFVLGVPKCGTTSIAGYLAAHRDIFISDPKELNYLARSLSVPGGFLSRQAWHTDGEEWLRLFAAAKPGVKAVGEGSTRYLRCKAALIQIKPRFSHAKLIVCLRNPADLAESWHSQIFWEGQEDQNDFELAWRLQAARAAGEVPLPPGLEEYDALEYDARRVGRKPTGHCAEDVRPRAGPHRVSR